MGRDYSERLTAWLLAGLIAGVLVFVPSGFDPFGPAKWLVVSTIGLAVAAVLLFRKYVAAHRGWTLGWLAFLIWGAIASVVAVDPVYTWIGTPDRHLGLFAWLLFFVLFVAGMSFDGRAAVLPLLKASVVALTGIGVYAGLELVGFAPVALSSTADRIGGPFGSAAYLGAACALLLPIAVGAAVDGLGSVWWRRVALVASVLGVVAALGAQTRAGWIGLVVAAAIALPVARPWIGSHRAVIAGAGLALVVVAIATPIGGRVVSAFDFDSGGARGRIDEWRVGAAVMVEHPVTGLGFEGYRIGFAEGVDAEYERRYGRVFAPDRAHNGALDVGLTAGVPALGLYVVGAIALLVAAARVVRRREPWLIGIAAGVVGYVAQQQFLFPLAEIDPLFWLFAGVVVAAASQLRPVAIPPGLWLIPTALAAAALVAGGLDVAADHAARRALDFEQDGGVAAAAAHASTAVSRRPDSIRYGFLAAGIAGRLGTPAGLRSALDQLDDALAVSPEDPILRAAQAGFGLDLAVAERDGSALRGAIAQWETLVAGDPHHAQYRLELGIAYAIGGRGDDAEREWLAAIGLAPGSTAPWVNLATLYLDSDRTGDAAAAIDRIQGLDPDASVLADLIARLAAQERENG